MSVQRKFNYSFRERRSTNNPASNDQSEANKPSPSQDTSRDVKQGPTYPSDCDNENHSDQKLPDPDQPISAAELESRKSAIRGTAYLFLTTDIALIVL